MQEGLGVAEDGGNGHFFGQVVQDRNESGTSGENIGVAQSKGGGWEGSRETEGEWKVSRKQSNGGTGIDKT